MSHRNYLAATLFLLCSSIGIAQKFGTKAGSIAFEASVPSFEPVAATHSSVSAVLNSDNGQLAVLALVTGFRFDIALMEEHFNENYMESEVYPKAILRGQIKDFDVKAIGIGNTAFQFSGSLEIHGVVQPFETELQFSKTDQDLLLSARFALKPEDFNIEIPKIVAKKIADEVWVAVQLQLKSI